MTCPIDEDLMKYLNDVLENEEKARVEEHVRGCERCRSALESMAEEDERFIRYFRESFGSLIGDDQEERIVTSLMTSHRIRREGSKPDVSAGHGDGNGKPG